MKSLILTITTFLAAIIAYAQEIPTYKAEQLTERISDEDTFYVVNFWATWCGPCVRELPEFDKLHQSLQNKPVKILLVSMDFKEDYPKKIARFMHKKQLQHEVIWLDETNANDFIPKIEEQWQGSIPATLLAYKKNEYRNFFEGAVKAGQLQLLIEKQLALNN